MDRLAVLFSCLNGYMAACLRTLCRRHNVELLVVRVPPSDNAPFDDRHFNWIDRLYDWTSMSSEDVTRELEAFSPDAVFMSGWYDQGYLAAAREMRRKGVFVVAGADAQWTGSWRQQGARFIAPWYLHTAIDVFWVPGERQRQLARRLGYQGARCWDGVYACDWERFAACYTERQSLPPAFLFVGRYVEEKGLDLLLEAYAQYRDRSANPWPLVCAGRGPLGRFVEEQEGAKNVGFVQPDALPDLMRETGAFVLPSRREPWGVVVQEAAAAGLPLLCSEASGAAVHLLQDGYNGYLVQSKSSNHLAQRLFTMSRRSEETRAQMGLRSYELSKQYTPARWADTLVSGVKNWYANSRSHASAAAQ